MTMDPGLELPIPLRSAPDSFSTGPAIAAIGQAQACARTPWQQQLVEAVLANEPGPLDQMLRAPEAEELFEEGFDLPLMTLALAYGSVACWRVWVKHGHTLDRTACGGGVPMSLAQLACEVCDPVQLKRLLEASILDPALCLDHGLRSGSRNQYLLWAQHWQDTGLPFDVAMQQLCHAGSSVGATTEMAWRARDLGKRWVARMGILRSWRLRRLWFSWLAQPPAMPPARPLWRAPLLRAMRPYLGKVQIRLAMETDHQRRWSAVLLAAGMAGVEHDDLRRFALCLGDGMAAANGSHDLLWQQMQQVMIEENPLLLDILPNAMQGRQRPSTIADRLGTDGANACRLALLLELDTPQAVAGTARRGRL